MHAVLVLEPGIDVQRRRARRPTRGCRITSASATASVWPGTRAAAHRRHAQAETRGDPRLGRSRAHSPARRPAGDSRRGADRAVRARPRRQRRHDARGARPELARTRRADGGARGSVSDAHRRRRGSPRRASVGDLKQLVEQAPSRRGRRGAGRLSVVEPQRGRSRSSGGCRWRPGSCRWRACSRTCASRGCEHLRSSTGRSSSRRTIRATWTCR